MRKRTKRRVWSTPAIPITFSMQAAGLNNCRLLGAAAIDAVVTGVGTDDHIAQLKQVADYCLLLSMRLQRDDTVAEPAELIAATLVAKDGLEVVGAMQHQFVTTGKVTCGERGHASLLSLLDINDTLDAVATRRQARDVAAEMVAAIVNHIRSGADHESICQA